MFAKERSALEKQESILSSNKYSAKKESFEQSVEKVCKNS